MFFYLYQTLFSISKYCRFRNYNYFLHTKHSYMIANIIVITHFGFDLISWICIVTFYVHLKEIHWLTIMDRHSQQKIRITTQVEIHVQWCTREAGGIIIVTIATWMGPIWMGNINRLLMGWNGKPGRGITTHWKKQ